VSNSNRSKVCGLARKPSISNMLLSYLH
jgi:hypothetical protein